MEEYVDGIHFLLSLGIECGMEDVEEITPAGGNVSLSEQFVKVYEAVCSFRSAKNRSSYINMLSEYLLLGKLLGFSPEAVKEAYIMKNKVNFERHGNEINKELKRMAKMDETLTMLKELTDAKGIPGNEREVREVMKKYISPYADEITTDGLGSLIAKKTGKADGPKIMLAGQDRKSVV